MSDLRRMMKEAKSKRTVDSKVKSPLALYSKSGDLICKLCKVKVNHGSWSIHVSSKSHLHALMMLKDSKKASTNNPKDNSTISMAESLKKDLITTTSSSQSLATSTTTTTTTASMNESTTSNADNTDEHLQNTVPKGFFDNKTDDAYVRGIDVVAVKKQEIDDALKEFDSLMKEVEVDDAALEEIARVTAAERTEDIQREQFQFEKKVVVLKEKLTTSRKRPHGDISTTVKDVKNDMSLSNSSSSSSSVVETSSTTNTSNTNASEIDSKTMDLKELLKARKRKKKLKQSRMTVNKLGDWRAKGE